MKHADQRPIAVLVDREGMGDVMLKTPFLRAVRRAFPDNEVWWIAMHQSSMADDLRTIIGKDVAKVITHADFDVAPVGPRLRALPPFERVFDGRTKISSVALARFGLKHRGFYCCLPGYVLCDGRPPARARPRHIAERMLSLVTCAIGAPADGAGRLEASAKANEAARDLLPDGPAYVGIAPGSRERIKNWPMERYCEVARALIAQGLAPVIFLGPMETDAKAEIEAATPGAIVLQADGGLPAEATIDRLIAQGQRLSLLLANDNGVGHLIGAAGAPVVSLFGPTDPARWAPVAPANLILSSRDFGGERDIEAIPTGAVIEAVTSMLDRLGPGAGQAPPAMKS